MEKVDKRVVTLSEVQMGAMRNLLERYEKGVPRSLKMERTQLPCVVFTDGACEPGPDGQVVCTVGGVIFDPNEGGAIEAFGSHVLTGKVLRRCIQLPRQKCMRNA